MELKAFITVGELNTSATVHIPLVGRGNISESGRDILSCQEIAYINSNEQYFVVKLGSGKYIFNIN